ncbi:MAG: ABC transporter substrate-binding protein, partial [Candidatus Solibacter usitatus]|nr:ABC transporter substrate-binding protein [Candidatus Solibacter usitatus]
IISTSPSITETLFALGLGPQVVGVSTYCHYPPETARIAKVGTFLKPNIEVIARLQPGMVIVQRLPNQALDQLRSLHIPVLEVETGNLRQNLDCMLVIGKAAQREDKAKALVAGIERQLDAMRARTARTSPRGITFIVGRTPGRLDGLIVVGGGSYLSELMSAAGGKNIFDDSRQSYLKTSLEVILRRNPAVLIDMGEMAETVGVTEQAKRAVLDLWSTQPSIEAVKRKHVHAVASDIFVVPGPRMLDAAQAFFQMLHPEWNK